jgi:serine/threonine-protein kinase
MLNQTVGNYRILSLLGEGGMGVVYLAQHPAIGRKAAIKVLHADLARNPDLVNRFFNEARAANAIKHPGIVEVYDFGTLPDGATYITMEFLEGESLSARIKRTKPLPIAGAVDFAYQIASALGAAHAARIVHRDLKPDNIYIVPDMNLEGREVIKILDFGIAKLSAEGPGAGGVKTRTGAVMGTPVYMSPEQCRGTKEVDHRTDIYALGIILYEMICGQPPFLSGGFGELIHMHIATPPAPPRSHNPAVAAELEAVVLKMLAKDAGQRYQSMGEVQQALRSVRSDLVSVPQLEAGPRASKAPRGVPSVQTTFSAAASTIEGEPQKARRLGVPVLVAVLAVAGGVGVALRMAGHREAPIAPAAPAPAQVTPPAPPQVTPPPPAPSAPPPTISISIKSTPPGARLVRERDGADIGVTPFSETWPKDVGAEKMRLELDGYRPEPFAVPLERGVDLSFTLTSLPPAAAHKQKTPAAHHRGGPARGPEPDKKSEPLPL